MSFSKPIEMLMLASPYSLTQVGMTSWNDLYPKVYVS